MNEKVRSNCLSKRVFFMGRAYAAFLGAAIALFGGVPAVAADDNPANVTGETAPQICVVVPHFKDEYWLSVGHGLIEESTKTQSRLLMFESGGYHASNQQIKLLHRCIRENSDVVLLGAVSADDPALLATVKEVAQTTPVIALVNALHSPDLAGTVGVDWRDMGAQIGRHLTEKHPTGTPAQNAVLVTGPKVSGWSPLLEQGLAEGLRGSSVQISHIARSDTGLREQLAATEAALRAVPGADLIIGSAPAIEGAMGLAAHANGVFPNLIATYISHSVRRGLQNGAVSAVAFDDPVAQGRLGVRVAQQAIHGKIISKPVGPAIQLVTSAMVTRTALPLSPAGLQLGLE